MLRFLVLSGVNLAMVPGACCVWALGVESVTGMLVSPWSGGVFSLRNDVSEAQTGFKHLPSAPAFLFHLALSAASELPTLVTTSHNSFAMERAGVLCVHTQSVLPKVGQAPAGPTLSFYHRPGLSECDHHRNHQDQQPGRTVVLSEYLWDAWGPQSLTAAGKGAAPWGGEGFGATLNPVSGAPECLSCCWAYSVTTETKWSNKSWSHLGPRQVLPSTPSAPRLQLQWEKALSRLSLISPSRLWQTG